MPVIKSAKKKLRQDHVREKRNNKLRNSLKEILKKAKKTPSTEVLQIAFSAIDKASKNQIIHKNKAARMKSSLSKLIGKEPTEKKPVPSKKSSSKKTSSKSKS